MEAGGGDGLSGLCVSVEYPDGCEGNVGKGGWECDCGLLPLVGEKSSKGVSSIERRVLDGINWSHFHCTCSTGDKSQH